MPAIRAAACRFGKAAVLVGPDRPHDRHELSASGTGGRLARDLRRERSPREVDPAGRPGGLADLRHVARVWRHEAPERSTVHMGLPSFREPPGAASRAGSGSPLPSRRTLATACVQAQTRPCHLAGRSLRPSWPPLARCWPRFGILPALASNAARLAGASLSSPWMRCGNAGCRNAHEHGRPEVRPAAGGPRSPAGPGMARRA
jgi:hypothetical protein